MSSLKGIRAALPLLKLLTGMSSKLPGFDQLVAAAAAGRDNVILTFAGPESAEHAIQAYWSAGFSADHPTDEYWPEPGRENRVFVEWG